MAFLALSWSRHNHLSDPLYVLCIAHAPGGDIFNARETVAVAAKAVELWRNIHQVFLASLFPE